MARTTRHYFPMSPAELRQALETLKMSQDQLAALFEAAPRTVRVWALGEGNIPPVPAIVIRLLVIGAITTKEVQEAISSPVGFKT